MPLRIHAALAMLLVLLAAHGSARSEGPKVERVVCLGDSITDGNTYPLLLEQALVEAGKAAPLFINAGIGGDTAAGMHARLEADVIARRPDIVLLSAGINDIHQGKALADYLVSMSAIADALAAKKIKLIVLTTTGVRDPARQQKLHEWNAALGKLAAEKEVAVADVAAAFASARKAGDELWEPDGIHLSFAGYRVMVRAVLDGLGHRDVRVPEKARLTLEAGAIIKWRVRPATDDKPLTADEVAKLKIDERWKEYPLPEPDAHDAWWFDQERQRGFAVQLNRYLGPVKRFQASASIPSETRRDVYLLPGADVHSIWLNGERVYQAPERHGWHVGAPISVALKAGDNQVLLETGNAFFLAVRNEAP